MRKHTYLFAALLSCCVLFNSCKNDLDVMDDWKETMVVFGLLNPSDSVQYIKVNKAFLGEENALTMAGFFDSINYRNNALDVRIEKIQNNVIVQTIPLFLDSLMPKDTGIFAYPKQYLFRTSVPILQDGSLYKLVVTNENSGLVVSGTTDIVQNVSVTSPLPSQTINVYGSQPYKAKWLTSPNGRLYNLMIRFHYKERFIFDTTQIAYKYIDIPFVDQKAVTTNGGEIMTQIIEGESFFRSIGNSKLLPDNQNLERFFISLEFIITAAAEEFSTYLDVVQSTSGAFNEPPVYTNLENGIGLFSSRLNQRITGVGLNSQCLDSLKEGQFTVTKNFR